MYTIYVVFKCFPGKREAYVEKLLSEGYLDAIRNEDGCVRYDYYFSQKDENELLLIEEWESLAHQQAHIKTPHMVKALALGKDYVESSKLGEFKFV